MDAESEIDNTSGGGDNLSDADNVQYGIRQTRKYVSSSKWSTRDLYPGHILTMEFMLSLVEPSLSQYFTLAFIVALLGIHKHQLVSQLREWQSMAHVPEETIAATLAMVHELKNALNHVTFLIN